MKSTMDLSDLLGLHLLMMRIPGRGEFKVLVAGLGETYFKDFTDCFLVVCYFYSSIEMNTSKMRNYSVLLIFVSIIIHQINSVAKKMKCSKSHQSYKFWQAFFCRKAIVISTFIYAKYKSMCLWISKFQKPKWVQYKVLCLAGFCIKYSSEAVIPILVYLTNYCDPINCLW